MRGGSSNMPLPKSHLTGLLALVVAAVLGAAVGPSLVRAGLTYYSPLTFNLLRSISPFLFTLPLVYKYRHLVKEPDFKQLLTIAAFTFSMNILLFSLGITRTTIVTSQLLYALLPFTVPLLSLLLLKTKTPRSQFLGSGISFIGVALLMIFSYTTPDANSLGTPQGNVLILGAVFSYSLYLTLSQKFSQKYPPLFIAATSFLSSSLFFLPLSIGEMLAQPRAVDLSLEALSVVILMGLSSVIFLTCIQVGIKQLGSITTAISTLLAPEIAAITGMIFFDEEFSAILLVSIIFVSTGIVISVLSKKPTWQEKIAIKLHLHH